MSRENKTDDQPSGTQSLFRGLQLLEILGNYPNGCPLITLSELSALNKSTTHRLLQGLIACGYVTPTSTQGSYRLTTKLISVGYKSFSSLNIIHLAVPYLEQLNLITGATINFSCREADHVVLINKLEPTTGMMRTRAYIGQHSPLYCTAMGKLYLAFGSEDKLKQYWQSNKSSIKQLTNHTITHLSDMKKELKSILAQYVARDREENELGVSCLAAPIFDVSRQIRYAVSISLPTILLEKRGEKSLVAPLLETAAGISKELGYLS